MDILDRLFLAMETGHTQDVLGRLLDEMIQYTAVHFTTEERYFRDYDYPHAATHKQEHDDLAEQVRILQEDFKAGKTAISVQIGEFLRQWLTGHILGSDLKYAPFLTARGVR